MLVPVPEYPIVSKTGEDENAEPDNSLYKEDGSLEVSCSDYEHYFNVSLLLSTYKEKMEFCYLDII